MREWLKRFHHDRQKPQEDTRTPEQLRDDISKQVRTALELVKPQNGKREVVCALPDELVREWEDRPRLGDSNSPYPRVDSKLSIYSKNSHDAGSVALHVQKQIEGAKIIVNTYKLDTSTTVPQLNMWVSGREGDGPLKLRGAGRMEASRSTLESFEKFLNYAKNEKKKGS